MSKYGYFDETNKEYVIERPDTPMSWINYLGTSKYCAIISNNAAGYSFYQSPKSGRLLRFRFNGVPMDRPGRYIYLRDEADGDYWSASWQPVGKKLDQYKSVCRHGLGYSTFQSEYRSIRTDLKVFVPIDKAMEFWQMDITNCGDQPRELSLFGYAEWCFWESFRDTLDFQYILYTCRMGCVDGIVDYSIRLWDMREPKAFFASTLPVEGFETDRDAFVGPYRDEGNPLAVERGACNGSIAVGGNPCAALHNRIKLQPGEKVRVVYMVGIGDAAKEGRDCRERYSNPEEVGKEFAKVQDYWNARLGAWQCSVPDAQTNAMMQVWTQYQCHTTFNWSRAASFIEAGGRDGLGFRDSNQDLLAVIHVLPDQVRTRLVELIRGQLSDGSAMHQIQPLSWKQGAHNIPADSAVWSDDHLWLLLSVPAYIRETGDMAFLDEILEFADSGKASVYDHLKKTLEFSWSKRGPHGLLLGMMADWNDTINLRGQGESVWSTMLFHLALSEMITLCRKLERGEDEAIFCEWRAVIANALATQAWDGEWFLRGYLDSGRKLGGAESAQTKIFINTQSWAVLSGVATPEQGIRAMDSLHEHLATEHGIVKSAPAFRDADDEIGAITTFPAGLKENGGIFCHANTWAIVAEAMLGRGDRAFKYYKSFLPAAKNDSAEVYTMEPYVYAQFITGREHPSKFGRARNSWLTGTAAWAFVAMSQYILGVRPDYDGLIIDPVIPPEWDGFTVTRRFRGTEVQIKVSNPNHVSRGVSRLVLNGKQIEGNTIPAASLQPCNNVEVELGEP
jgi:N,N'-diacetylchitobiose phosphorylase